jgi:hypothetical protein
MTDDERLLLLLVADALLGPGDVAVAEPTRTMIRNARHALDDEAYHMARATPQSAPHAKASE